jgi:hypothetical protein
VGKALLILLITSTGLQAGAYADRYATALEKLDTTDPRSACTARTALRETLPKADNADRTAMFRKFVSFFGSVDRGTIDKSEEAIAKVYERMDDVLTKSNWKGGSSTAAATLRKDPEIYQALAPWLDCGFGVAASEGNFYTDLDYASLLEFSATLPPDVKAWVRFLVREKQLNPVITEDGALVITWQQLGARLHRWEDFVRLHPTLDPEVSPEIHFLAGVFFIGIDNSQIEGDDGRIDPEVLVAWRSFANSPSQSDHTKLMRRILPVLEKNNYRITPEIRSMTGWVYLE